MRKHYFIIILLISVLFSGCTNQCTDLTQHEKSQIEKQILDEWGEISTAIENSDSEAYASFISPDLIMMASNGSVFYSKTEYIDNARNWFSSREKTEIKPEKITVTVLAADLALLNQLSVFKVTYKDGTVQVVHHVATFLFKKGPAGWMIIHGHESFEVIES